MRDRVYQTTATVMDQLLALAKAYSAEEIGDAITAWTDSAANDGDQDAPGWLDLLGSELRAALDVVADADACDDTCFIRIIWSDKSRAITFRFDAAQGAGPRLGAAIASAVASAAHGDAKGGGA
jgi:hypothetical protein